MKGARLIGENTIEAVRSVMTSSPDYLVLGMSAVTFFDGIEGANRFQASVEEASGGLKLSCGSHACAAALRAYGGIKRIAFFSPYFPAANAEVRRYFSDCGYEVVRDAVPAVPELDRDRRSPDTKPAARRFARSMATMSMPSSRSAPT